MKKTLLALLQWPPCGNSAAAQALYCSPRKGLRYSLRAAQVGLRLTPELQQRFGLSISTSPGH